MSFQDIQDSNPERRNLTVFSLAIILYYFADGSLIGNDVKLHIVNIKFSNPGVISIFLWAALCWFCLRFYQTTRGKYLAAYKEEIKNFSNNWLLRLYANRVFGISYNKKNGYNHAKIDYEKNYWYISCQKIGDITYDENNVIIGYEGGKGWTNNKKITGFMGFAILLYFRILSVLIKPAFSSFVFPYILFFTAILLYVYKHLYKL